MICKQCARQRPLQKSALSSPELATYPNNSGKTGHGLKFPVGHDGKPVSDSNTANSLQHVLDEKTKKKQDLQWFIEVLLSRIYFE